MTEEKSKWQLTVDFIMILGKYLETPRDFINVMKVCKRYEELVSMYKFNPISDISLFENIQTQHFYDENDIRNKKNNLFQYIYWYIVNYDDIINKNKNEIFKRIILKSYGNYHNITYPKIDIINGNCILPKNIIIIDTGCFFSNENLLSINLPNTLKEIRGDAFEGTKITTVNIPEGVTKIGGMCFSNCQQLTNITLPTTLKVIGAISFLNTEITSIIIPEGVTCLGYACFQNCSSLTNVILPHSLNSLQISTFENSNIKSIIIPEGITSIGNNCFKNCTCLSNLQLPDSLINLGNEAFKNTGITTVSIPKSVQVIGIGCFFNCKKLNLVILLTNNNIIIEDSLDNDTKILKIQN